MQRNVYSLEILWTNQKCTGTSYIWSNFEACFVNHIWSLEHKSKGLSFLPEAILQVTSVLRLDSELLEENGPLLL